MISIKLQIKRFPCDIFDKSIKNSVIRRVNRQICYQIPVITRFEFIDYIDRKVSLTFGWRKNEKH